LLRHNQHKVSVNGTWPDSPANFVSLENPCLTDTELREANDVAQNKTSGPTVTICFVGGLVKAKGIHKFMDALELVKDKSKIKHVIIAGDGADRFEVERRANELLIPIQFLGNIKRDALNTVYTDSDIIVLPSATEGFPKVIAEAAAFGCVPVVTNVSSVGQYIVDKQNGILLKNAQPDTIAAALDHILLQNGQLTKMKINVVQLSELFTYERYCSRVLNEILFDSSDSHK
jgi:glycosyltransferase involved in cell wall biosynthesis